MKISATLASVGIPSFYLHPAEAVHGDLGRYTKSDIALILSKSGETPEILRILPHIKRTGCPVISVTCNNKSRLAQHSDLMIYLGALDEAGPLGLAPTTSTTAMLALGDALAMSILRLRGFSREDFATFHPGGELGRALTLVEELMRTGEEHCIVEETLSCREVIHRYSKTKRRPGAASIVNKDGVLVGVFTDGNLRCCLDSDQEFLDAPVSNYMGKTPKYIGPKRLADEALALMSLHKIDQLVVVGDDKRPLGMIDIQDVITIDRQRERN